jgi:NAD(P)-dependent dehydrogenase (short-subunit alcohol dehydrogenase family)
MSDSSDFRLDGRVAIVTGGAGGIGYETVKALQDSGAQTAIVDINPERGQKAAKELDTAFFQADLTKSEQVKKVADQVQQKYGRLDIAFNNAGIAYNVPSEDCSDEDWLRVININLNAVFFLLPRVRQDHASAREGQYNQHRFHVRHRFEHPTTAIRL